MKRVRVLIFSAFLALLTLNSGISNAQSPGSLDTSFDPGSGFVGGSVEGLVIQSDGKVVFAGNFTTVNGISRSYLARLNANGTYDSSFNIGTGPNAGLTTITLTTSGKILIGGAFTSFNGTARNRVARLNADGSLDTSFNPGSGVNANVWSLATQADGKILIGGDFTLYNGTARVRIVRVLSDGTLDNSFLPGTGANSTVNDIVVLSSGKMMISGSFTTYAGASLPRIARINSDATVDATFNPGTGFNSGPSGMIVQVDGKVVVTGSTFVSSYNGTAIPKIVRLTTTGAIDNTFNPGTGITSGGLFGISAQADGKLIVVGTFSLFDGQIRRNIARLSANGALDAGFAPYGANGIVLGTAIQADGKIVLAGNNFTQYDQVSRVNAARIFGGEPVPTITVNATELRAPTISSSATTNVFPTSYVLNGTNLSSNVSIFLSGTQAGSFELSESETTGFGSSLNIAPTNSKIVDKTIYLRLKTGLTAGSKAAPLHHTSTGATSKTITVTGFVNPPIEFPLTFEESTIDWGATSLGFGGGSVTVENNAVSGGINTSSKAAKMIKSGGEVYGGVAFTMSSTFDLTARPIIKLKVWSPRSNASLLVKIENETNGEQFFEVNQTIGTANQWKEMTYDLSGANRAFEYKKLTFIFDLGTVGDGSSNYTFWVDDVENIASTTPNFFLSSNTPTKVFANSIRQTTASYIVTASNMGSNPISVQLASTTQFELSKGAKGTVSPTGILSLTPTAGSVRDTIFYRLKSGLALGSYSVQINHTGTGVTAKSATLSGEVVAPAVTYSPTSVTEADALTITLDARLTGLDYPNGLAGVTEDIYLFSGVRTDLRPTGWSGSHDWLGFATLPNLEKFKMKRDASNADIYTINIPYLRDFWGITNASESISTIEFLFRNADASKTGRDLEERDFVLTLATTPGIRVNRNSTVTLKETTISTASDTISYRLLADNLGSNPLNIVLSGTDYEMKLRNETTYRTVGGSNTSFSLTPISGRIDTVLNVRMRSGRTVGTKTATITHSSTSATSRVVNLTGTVSTALQPAINISGTLSPFSAIVGSASAAQSYTVSGTGFTNSIQIFPPNGFEIGPTQSGTYATSMGTSPTATVTVWVRLKAGNAAGLYSGNITHSSSGVTTQNLPVSGAVSNSTLPQIFDFSPSSGIRGSEITINGANFGATQGSSTVKFGAFLTPTVTSWGNTQIKILVPDLASINTGYVISVTTSLGTAQTASGFTVTAPATNPVISSITPSSGAVGSSVTIDGLRFGATQGTTKAAIGISSSSTTDLSVSSWSDTRIVATIPNIALGQYVIYVIKGAEIGSSQTFTVTATPPSIIGLSKNQGKPNETVVITGARFSSTANQNTVRFGTAQATVSQATTSSLTVVIPSDPVISGTKTLITVAVNSIQAVPTSEAVVDFYVLKDESVVVSAQSMTFLPNLSGVSDPAPTNYRMVSLPGRGVSPSSLNLATADITQWRLFRDAGTSNYVEMTNNASTALGEGAWLISRNPVSATSFNGSVAVSENSAFITVRPGSWNIIGNPFSTAVLWEDVRDENPALASSALRSFSGTTTFGISATMIPYQGYYVNVPAGVTSIKIPRAGSSKTRAKETTPFLPEWSLQLKIKNAENEDGGNRIGVSPAASVGKDVFELAKPPLVFDLAYLYFSRPDWDETFHQFSDDFRPEIGSGQTWNFEVRNKQRGHSELSISDVSEVPSHFAVMLLQLSKKVMHDVRKNPVFSFESESDEESFELLVGPQSFVQSKTREFVPSQLELAQNFPNPFNPSTTISFTLNTSGITKLSVFDLNGRKITDLVNGEKSAGYHSVNFNAAGLSSGIYLYRLETKAGVLMKKMALIK